MKNIREIDLNNKKVILRLDLNVTIREGKILDDTKIRKCIPTIQYLLKNNCSILIMSHLGKVKKEEDKVNNSLKLVCSSLEKMLGMNINFIPTTRGIELEESVKNNKITFMENTRYEDVLNNLESGCDITLAKYWSTLGDVFINDAFGTTHRRHASNYGISKFLPSAYGLLIEEELKGLEPIINSKRPFAVVMGGAKVDDKIKLIEKMLEECDYLLVGGGIANTFLLASGYSIGSSIVSKDYVSNISLLIKKYKSKIIMPTDVVIENNGVISNVNVLDIKDGTIYDIGNETIKKYSNILAKMNTVFLNGTMGLYEDDRFKNGTVSVLESLSKIKAIKVAGGGDAVTSVNNLNFTNSFNFLSTGGGATLEYLINKKLNCFEDEQC